MRKLFAAFAVILAFLSVQAYAFPGDPRNPDIVNYSKTLKGSTSIMFSIDAFGNVMPGRHDQGIGVSSHIWNKGYFDELNTTDGMIAVKEHWMSIPVNDPESMRNVPITTTSLFATGGTTWLTLDVTQSTVPRSVVFFSSFTTGNSTTICRADVVIRGIDSTGRTTSERLELSTTIASKSTLAWALISSVTITGSSISARVAHSSVTLKMGTTNHIGLTNVIVSTANVFKIQEGSVNQLLAPQSSTVIISTHSTFVPARVPDGSREYWIWYRTRRTVPRNGTTPN